jgi:hypothetical protein
MNSLDSHTLTATVTVPPYVISGLQELLSKNNGNLRIGQLHELAFTLDDGRMVYPTAIKLTSSKTPYLLVSDQDMDGSILLNDPQKIAKPAMFFAR